MKMSITTSSLERRKNEISDAFDYLKHLALNTLESKKATQMYFTLDFDPESVPKVSYDISELFMGSSPCTHLPISRGERE